MISKKEFYFIRHGQTDYNASDAKVDHEDVSLNAVGLRQAQAVEPVIRTLPIKSICTSPLKRATETKEVISSKLITAHHEIDALGECSFQIWNDMTSCGPSAYRSGKEHVKNFIQRVLTGLNETLSLEGPPLIVAHGGVHWAICCLMEVTEHDWFIDNCLPVHFFPDDTGRWKARKLLPK